MSYHCHTKWKFDDPISKELIDEIASGLESNKEYNKHNGSDTYVGCYMTLNELDAVFINLAKFLDCKVFTKSALDSFCVGSPNPEKVREIVNKVCEKKNISIT